MNKLIEKYQSICLYDIVDNVQNLNLSIDIDKLQKEILNFLIFYQYGVKPISLKYYEPNEDPMAFLDPNEDVWHSGIGLRNVENIQIVSNNPRPDSEYVHWHPYLKNSYVKEVSEILENHSGLKIGRIRLTWLYPDSGYPMHVDLEPMRFHIPLITNKLNYFITEDKIYRMDFGNVYHLITTTEHTTRNFGNTLRLHLIFSTYYDESITDIIKKTVNEDSSIKGYFDALENSGLNQRSIFQLMQIDVGNNQKYQRILDNLKKST